VTTTTDDAQAALAALVLARQAGTITREQFIAAIARLRGRT
jgi:hypothetical protein